MAQLGTEYEGVMMEVIDSCRRLHYAHPCPERLAYTAQVSRSS